MHRLLLPLVLLVLVVAHAAHAEVKPLKGWRQMRSANFYLIGDVGEGDLRRVAGRLEQFRAAVGVLLPMATMTTATPTTVLVFRTHNSYEPFKPIHNGKVAEHIGGYFMPGEAVNYITLTTESRGQDYNARYGVIYHELVHLMLNNTLRGVPVWINEGLAEYYEKLDIQEDGKRVVIGNVHSPHVMQLRQRFLALDQLVAVDRRSELYNERSKASIFYAESWALVHYLLLGKDAAYATKAPALFDALASGESFDVACQKTLGVSVAQLQKELESYVGRDEFPRIGATLSEPLTAIERLSATPLPDADAHAVAGGLLLGMGRLADATAHLEFALALAPESTEANTTMGRLKTLQNQLDLARVHLQRAAHGPGATAQAHFHLAVTLQRIRLGGGDAGADADARIEAALRKAIAIDPGFAEGHASLARVLADRPGSGDEVFQLQQKAIALAPGREDYWLNFGIYLVNRQQFSDARTILTAVAARASDDRMKTAAADLLKRITDFERRTAAGEIAVERGAGGPRVIQFDLRKVKDGEAQLKGELLAIECPRGQIRFVVGHQAQTSRVHAGAFDGIEFITYRRGQSGTISCGERPPGDRVLVTYRPGPQADSLGEVVAVEFMPPVP